MKILKYITIFLATASVMIIFPRDAAAAYTEELVVNGSFTYGSYGWNTYWTSDTNVSIIAGTWSGCYSSNTCALLLPNYFDNDAFYQRLYVPIDAKSAFFSVQYKYCTTEAYPQYSNDSLTIRVYDETLKDFVIWDMIRPDEASCSYTLGFADISQSRGHFIQATFDGYNDGLYHSSAYIDDVSVLVDYSPVVTKVKPNVAAISGGERITVTGKHFTPNTDVYIGGKLAENITYKSQTKIVVTAPVHTLGTKHVVVSDPSTGYSDQKNNALEYKYAGYLKIPVFDEDGKPITGATVRVSDPSTTYNRTLNTGSKNFIYITVPISNTYKVFKGKSGHHNRAIKNIRVSKNNTKEVKFSILKKGVTQVKGRVVDVKDSRPINNTTITIRDKNGKIIKRGRSNTNGYYVLNNVPTGYRKTIWAKKSGYRLGNRTFDLGINSQIFNFKLKRR